MFENHRQLIEAVQQDSALPELRGLEEMNIDEWDDMLLDLSSDVAWLRKQGVGNKKLLARKVSAMASKLDKMKQML